jgi:hypothetical protein
VRIRQLAEIGAAFPTWRGWQTPTGELAARKGGSTPIGVQARGRTIAELKLAIAFAIMAAANGGALPAPDLPVLRPHEQAALDAVQAATGPLTARAISDVSGVPTGTIAKALAVLRARHLVTRGRDDGRTWLYTAAGQPGDGHQRQAAG